MLSGLYLLKWTGVKSDVLSSEWIRPANDCFWLITELPGLCECEVAVNVDKHDICVYSKIMMHKKKQHPSMVSGERPF